MTIAGAPAVPRAVAAPPVATEVAFTQAAVHQHMPALDGLRGLAILFVIWNHVGLGGGSAEGLLSKLFVAGANAGWIGVHLFFVLSGFLITGILLDARGQPDAWRNFFMRRVLRIFPLYYFTLAFLFILLPAIGALPAWLEADYKHQFWYWTYLSNWSVAFGLGGQGVPHFWSLAVEEQFYLVWPLLVLWMLPRTLAKACLALIAIALAARINFMYFQPRGYFWTEAAYSWTISQLDTLAIGALVALGLREARWTERLLRHGRLVGGAAAVGMLVVIVRVRGFGIMSQEVMTIGKTLFSLLAGAVLVDAVARPDSPVGRIFLRRPTLAYLGKYSYAIYIFHLPIAHAFRSLFPITDATQGTATTLKLFAQMVVVLLISLALARVSWLLIEQPFLRLKTRFPMRA